VPATFCGIFGLRPTPGRVPHVQALDPAGYPPTADIMSAPGPLARSLGDLWTVLRVLAGADPRDPVSVPVPAPPERPLRPDPPVVARLDRHTGAVLAPAGYRVVDAGFPGGTRAPELWAELIGPELIFAAMPAWREILNDSN